MVCTSSVARTTEFSSQPRETVGVAMNVLEDERAQDAIDRLMYFSCIADPRRAVVGPRVIPEDKCTGWGRIKYLGWSCGRRASVKLHHPSLCVNARLFS